MRSRTSRGVPEWSGGKDLYMGSLVLVAGKVLRIIGIVSGVPKGVRGSTKGSTCPGGPHAPGGHMGCGVCALAYMGQGNQPQEAHAPRDKGKEESKRGKAPPRCLGEVGLLPGRTLPWRKGQGCAPLSLGPIYSGGKGGQQTLSPGASLSLP